MTSDIEKALAFVDGKPSWPAKEWHGWREQAHILANALRDSEAKIKVLAPELLCESNGHETTKSLLKVAECRAEKAWTECERLKKLNRIYEIEIKQKDEFIEQVTRERDSLAGK